MSVEPGVDLGVATDRDADPMAAGRSVTSRARSLPAAMSAEPRAIGRGGKNSGPTGKIAQTTARTTATSAPRRNPGGRRRATATGR